MTDHAAPRPPPVSARLRAALQKLALFDRLVPKDRGGRLAVEDLPYGRHPRQRLDLYLPVAAAGPLPRLLFIYGGSWDHGRKADYGFVGRAFAAAGFATGIPDYRLVPEVHFPDFLVDCGRALAAFSASAAAQGGTGPVFLVGHSAGAYNAVMLALDDGLARAAGYQRRAIGAVAGLAGPYDFLPFEMAATRAAFGKAADLRATQPVHLARADAPPMLLLTGDADELVRPRNAERLAAALTARGARAAVHRYPGLGHAGPLVRLARPLRGHRGIDIRADITAFFRAQGEALARPLSPERVGAGVVRAEGVEPPTPAV